MVLDTTGIVHLVLMGLTEHVFGNIVVTSTVIMLIFVIFALLIQIPLPFALVIPVPFAVVLTAYGYLTVVVGAVLSVTFLVMSIISFLAGMGNK